MKKPTKSKVSHRRVPAVIQVKAFWGQHLAENSISFTVPLSKQAKLREVIRAKSPQVSRAEIQFPGLDVETLTFTNRPRKKKLLKLTRVQVASVAATKRSLNPAQP